MAKNFIPVNLPASTVKKIKKLKIAYSFTSGRIPSYEDMFDMLIESVEKSNPALYNIFRNLPDETSVNKL